MLPPIYCELNFVREIRQKCFRLLGEGHSRQFVAERLKGAFIKRFHLKKCKLTEFRAQTLSRLVCSNGNPKAGFIF